MAHPKDLVKTAPKTNIHNNLESGIPLLESHRALKVGHKSKKMPIGLLSLIKFMYGHTLII